MKLIVSIFLGLLIAGGVSGQSWKELNDSLIYYYNARNYPQGIIVGEKAVLAAKKEFKANDQNQVYTLSYLAQIYYFTGQYEKAEPLYLRGWEISKKLGENHPYYLSSLAYLSSFYNNRSQYDKKEPYLLEIIKTNKKLMGESSQEHLNSLAELAELYRQMGQYEKSEPLFLQTLETFKNLSRDTTAVYATCFNNLGRMYSDKGQLDKAEAVYLQVKELRKRYLGETHPDYASSLNSLAVLYNLLGQFDKAESLIKQYLVLIQKTLGEMHQNYATGLGNLAALYYQKEQYEQSVQLTVREMEIYKKILGESSPSYANSLQNLAMDYFRMNQNEKAGPLFIRATEINKKVLGEAHPNYARSMRNLGVFYHDEGQYDKADSCYKIALDIFKNKLGDRNPMYAVTLSNLADMYKDRGQYPEAEPLYRENSQIVLQNMVRDFGLLTEKEKGLYLSNTLGLVSKNNRLLHVHKNPSAATLQNNYNLLLVLKSLTLADTKNILSAVKANPDTAVQRLWSDWQLHKKLLGIQYGLPVSRRRTDLSQLEAETNEMENELARRSASFRQQQETGKITVENVDRQLDTAEAAIEFVRYGLGNSKGVSQVFYAAYLLKKGTGIPVFVPLCEEKKLQTLFDSAGKTATGMVSKFYRGLGTSDQRSAFLGKELYQLVWEPLEPFLKGVKKIAYCPAGKLYSIAFPALAADSSTLLMDKYLLQQYTSTRQVVIRRTENRIRKPENICLFGNARFSMDSSSLAQQKNNSSSNEIAASGFYGVPGRGNTGAVWSDLPGTGEEVKKINSLFEQHKLSTRSYAQTTATEENLKALSGNSPQILHIATHGFFLNGAGTKKEEDGFNESDNYSLANDPLLRSGLILAGGNYAWSGKTPVEGVEDGIATAYEISQLDLGNTELVVLSACETALGDVQGNEGVFGLQRAFKMAGVKKMIVSLWQVPDKETAELMTTFYSFWMEGKTVEEAFAAAQAAMRKKYSPYYWAAFVLVE